MGLYATSVSTLSSGDFGEYTYMNLARPTLQRNNMYA